MGTLEKVAEIGYRHIELANLKAFTDPGTGFGISADKMRAKLEALKLEVIASHVQPLEESNVDSVIKYHRDLGNKNIVIPIDFWTSKEHLIERCALYNKLGERCRVNGMKLFYHNHYHEFQRFEGHYILDIIADNTESGLLGLELDAYFVVRAMVNPVEKIRQYSGRVAFLHQKDFPLSQVQHLNVWLSADQNSPLAEGPFQSKIKPEYSTQIGEGMLKIQDVVDAGNEAKVPYIFVEQDYMQGITEFQSIERSLRNFKKMRGIN
jgi:sugar phosphate isomerase/epimerase